VCAYKTVSGRHEWLNRDPIQETGGLNLYAYVANNPLNRIDPFGLYLTSLDTPAGQMLMAWLWSQPTPRWTPSGPCMQKAPPLVQAMNIAMAVLPFLGVMGDLGNAAEGVAGNATTGAVNTWWGGPQGLAAAQASGGTTLTLSSEAEAAAAAGDYGPAVQESQAAAQAASGAQQAFLGPTGGSIFLGTELPALLANPAVTTIEITF
jgi:uncharacterized protein RhaS with RHS repeats